MVVLDCLTGDLLALVSMPAYDPNSFSDGIGQTEWRMLSRRRAPPLLNKVAERALPAGIDDQADGRAGAARGTASIPTDRIHCPGGYQLGNRFFRCLGRHGSVDMHRAIAKSCNTYFYAMGHRVGYRHDRADGAAARASARSSTCRSCRQSLRHRSRQPSGSCAATTRTRG